jgi:molybdopterin converting factor small subunit
MVIRIVVSGRNYDLAERIPRRLTLGEGATLDEALNALAGLLPDGRALPASCLIAVSGTHLGTIGRHRDQPLAEEDELLLLAPVAGG